MPEFGEILHTNARDLMRFETGPDRLLKLAADLNGRPALFHFSKLPKLAQSAADLALLDDPETKAVFEVIGRFVVDAAESAAQVYSKEVLLREAGWSSAVHPPCKTPARVIDGFEDPSLDAATIADYREAYPWIIIEVVSRAGQMLMYQNYETLVPQFAKVAQMARGS